MNCKDCKYCIPIKVLDKYGNGKPRWCSKLETGIAINKINCPVGEKKE